MRATLFTILIATASCTSDDAAESTLAEETVDSALTGHAEAAVLVTLLDGVPSTTPTATAQAITSQVAQKLQPPGCATATTSGATTTIEVASCTGARGLAAIDGTIVLEVTAVTPTSINFRATATEFAIGGATLDVAVTGAYLVASGTTSVAITSSTTGTGSLGHAVSHAGEYTATWDASCASIDGSWATTSDVGSRSLDVAVRRCTTGCPSGSVSRSRATGGSMAVVFDGTATAMWSTTNRAGTIALGCTP